MQDLLYVTEPGHSYFPCRCRARVYRGEGRARGPKHGRIDDDRCLSSVGRSRKCNLYMRTRWVGWLVVKLLLEGLWDGAGQRGERRDREKKDLLKERGRKRQT